MKALKENISAETTGIIKERLEQASKMEVEIEGLTKRLDTSESEIAALEKRNELLAKQLKEQSDRAEKAELTARNNEQWVELSKLRERDMDLEITRVQLAMMEESINDIFRLVQMMVSRPGQEHIGIPDSMAVPHKDEDGHIKYSENPFTGQRTFS